VACYRENFTTQYGTYIIATTN
jgi:hypothetical protein